MQTMMAGPSCLLPIAYAQAIAVSAPSAGRNRVMFGMSRKDASCSIDWWVGPSSPRNTESCVYTKIDGMCISAESRMAGRM